MRATVWLSAGSLSAEIVPSLGGGVARFDILRRGQTIGLFRASPPAGTDDPCALGLNVLVPWSNRIEGGVMHYSPIHYRDSLQGLSQSPASRHQWICIPVGRNRFR